MYESENQALSTHPDFFDPIHKSAEVVMIEEMKTMQELYIGMRGRVLQ